MAETSLNLPDLTVAYRRLVLWVGVNVVANLCALLLQTMWPHHRQESGFFSLFTVTTVDGGVGYGVLSYVLSTLNLVVLAALMIYTYRTAKALAFPSLALWGSVLAMLMPFMPIIIVLGVFSSKAAKVCRDNGIPVGLFGPRPKPIA